jgi:hypothetical protein
LTRAFQSVLAIVLASVLSVSALGQQPLTRDEIRHVEKVRKKLGHFAAGTKLDVELSSGSRATGTLNQAGATSFILIDSASNKAEAIDYLDVRRVQPSRKEYISQQLGKTAKGLPKVALVALVAVAAILVVVVVVK